MKFTLVIFSIFASGTWAMAQDGIVNRRDSSGNLIRNTGNNAVKGSSVSSSAGVRSENGPTPPLNSRSKGTLQNKGPASNFCIRRADRNQFPTTRSSPFQAICRRSRAGV